jgi:hypothetical protein
MKLCLTGTMKAPTFEHKLNWYGGCGWEKGCRAGELVLKFVWGGGESNAPFKR